MSKPARPVPHALVLAAAALLAGCSVQEIALIPVAVIQGRITVPDGQRAITIRVNRVGTTTERTPPSAEHAFCDVEGDFVLKTNKLGGGFIVARGVEFDMGYAPVFLEEYGTTLEVERLLPSTGAVELFAKTPGSSLFTVFEEDFEPDFGEITSIDLVGVPDPVSGSPDFELDNRAIPLHDDGSLFDIDPLTAGVQTSGDVAAGDGVWTVRTRAFPSGQQLYGFYINKNTTLGVQRDPYEESSVETSATVFRSQILVK